MHKGDALKVRPGDKITLYHNLGGGEVVKVGWTPRESPGILDDFPMFQYINILGRAEWCTYRVVKTHKVALRSVP